MEDNSGVTDRSTKPMNRGYIQTSAEELLSGFHILLSYSHKHLNDIDHFVVELEVEVGIILNQVTLSHRPGFKSLVTG